MQKWHTLNKNKRLPLESQEIIVTLEAHESLVKKRPATHYQLSQMALNSLNSTENKEQSPEKVDEKPKLSESQLQFADEKFDEAVKEGVLRREDRMKLYARLTKFTPSQIENAEDIIKEYLDKKREKREEYITEIDNAVTNGLISVYDHKNYLADYDKMSGQERKKEATEDLPKRLEQKKLEKKAFGDLIKESPHFFHEGSITPEGEKLMKEFADERKSEKERLLLKRRLIKKLERLDHFSGLCKKRYQVANEHYQRGEYEASVALMKKNIKTCERYPESARLKEFSEFAQWDANNGAYEMIKDRQVQEKREEVQECFKGKDHENAVLCAQQALQMTKDFIAKTYDGRLGEYQEGSSPEKARNEKWVTPYMRSMLQKVQHEADVADQSYKKFFQEEQAEEERLLAEATDDIDREESEDLRNQALIKATTDTLEGMNESKETQQEESPVEQELVKNTSAPVDSSELNQEVQLQDLEEEQDVESIFESDEVTHNEETSFNDQPSSDKQQELTVEQAQTLSSEQVETQEVVIDEQQQGELEQRQAEELLRTQAKLKLRSQNQDIDSEQKLKEHSSKKLAQSRRERIQKKVTNGEITQERADILLQQSDEMQQSNKLGQEIIDTHRKQGRIVQFGGTEQTQKNIRETFKRTRDDRAAAQKLREKNANNKLDQLKNAA